MALKPYLYLVEAVNDPYGLTRELPVANDVGKIEMNDTKYVLGHLNELVSQYPKIR